MPVVKTFEKSFSVFFAVLSHFRTQLKAPVFEVRVPVDTFCVRVYTRALNAIARKGKRTDAALECYCGEFCLSAVSGEEMYKRTVVMPHKNRSI